MLSSGNAFARTLSRIASPREIELYSDLLIPAPAK
jgi:hypothetical protein